MTFCDTCDPEIAVCDFCKHYRFNADAEGRYQEQGFCTFHNEQREPYWVCDDYFCEWAEREAK